MAIWRGGMNGESIEAALWEENHTRCDPPLNGEGVCRVASSLCRYKAEDTASVDGRFALTDPRNAATRCSTRVGPPLHRRRPVLAWDGTSWAYDNTGEVTGRMKQTVRAVRRRAGSPPPRRNKPPDVRKDIRRGVAHQRCDWVATSETRIMAGGVRFDLDPMLFGVANGTIDLRHGRLRERRREDR
jgi:hypothetical protein